MYDRVRLNSQEEFQAGESSLSFQGWITRKRFQTYKIIKSNSIKQYNGMMASRDGASAEDAVNSRPNLVTSATELEHIVSEDDELKTLRAHLTQENFSDSFLKTWAIFTRRTDEFQLPPLYQTIDKPLGSIAAALDEGVSRLGKLEFSSAEQPFKVQGDGGNLIFSRSSWCWQVNDCSRNSHLWNLFV